jgi:hypothetical protein
VVQKKSDRKFYGSHEESHEKSKIKIFKEIIWMRIRFLVSRIK